MERNSDLMEVVICLSGAQEGGDVTINGLRAHTRRVLEEVGLPAGSQVIVESEPDGSIRLRPAAVYPIELYSDDRVAELELENRLSDSLKEHIKKARSR